MLKLKTLSDEALVTDLKLLTSQERRIGIEILWHLREVDSRRLYAAMGYSSLWEFCVVECKYSENSAYRRIASMRALKEIPQLATALEEGTLSITTVAQVQSFCLNQQKQKTPVTLDEKKEIFKAIEGKSKLQTEKLLSALAPTQPKADSHKILSTKFTEIIFSADEELLKDLERIKNLSAHQKELGWNPSYLSLFKFLAKQVLKQIDPDLKKSKLTNPPYLGKVTPNPNPEIDPILMQHPETEIFITSNQPRRKISVFTTRALLKTAGHQCSYIDPKTKRRCSQKRGLQIDHIRPRALGGTDAPQNLRILCFTHNQWAAVEKLGANTSRTQKQIPTEH